MVDRGLATDRGVDLRQQRRRHLHVGHAAHVARCRETGEVADHATAEREHGRAAVGRALTSPSKIVCSVGPVLYASPSGR